MRSFGARLVAFFAVIVIVSAGSHGSPLHFNRIATFPICSQIDANCNTDAETVAEIVAVSEDGMTLIYTDSEQKQAGFVNITSPAAPKGLGTVALGGEPTSCAVNGNYVLVAVNTATSFTDVSGVLKVIEIPTKNIVREMQLGGQPDSIAVSPDKKYAAIAIENERDEDYAGTSGAPPQMPAGELVIVDTGGDVASWAIRKVSLLGLAGALYAEDPEPEYVSINSQNVAVVTLQENNAIALVDLASGTVTKSFTAGVVNLTKVDATEPALIMQTESLSNVPREPDGVTWITDSLFATADEGDLHGGSRGWTIYDSAGDVVYSSGSTMEHIAAQVGHYPEERSGNKGNEPENVFFGRFGAESLLFVNSERSSLVFVYNIDDPSSPAFLQVLPAGVGPEGGAAIPSRDLFVAACEKDSRDDKHRASLVIYHRTAGPSAYPTLISADRPDGTPIPWSALSGLGAGQRPNDQKGNLAAVEDSFYHKSRIFWIDTDPSPPKIVSEIRIVDTDGVFAAVAPYGDFTAERLAAMINSDKTVNIDSEGVAVTQDYMLVASEGSGTVSDPERPIKSLNFLFKVDHGGKILEVITLPDAVSDMQLRFGFEGVAIENDIAYVTFQRAWGSEANPRIGMYDMANKTWTFVFYPLDAPASQNGGWVGLSDITPLGDGKFGVLERDNQGGPDAAIKRIYQIDLSSVTRDSTITKTLVMDLMPRLKALNGLVIEKLEGLAAMGDGSMWIASDNDGVDDNSGETLLMRVKDADTTTPAASQTGDEANIACRHAPLSAALLVAAGLQRI